MTVRFQGLFSAFEQVMMYTTSVYIISACKEDNTLNEINMWNVKAVVEKDSITWYRVKEKPSSITDKELARLLGKGKGEWK